MWNQLISYRVSNPQTPTSPASPRRQGLPNPPPAGSPEGEAGGAGEQEDGVRRRETCSLGKTSPRRGWDRGGRPGVSVLTPAWQPPAQHRTGARDGSRTAPAGKGQQTGLTGAPCSLRSPPCSQSLGGPALPSVCLGEPRGPGPQPGTRTEHTDSPGPAAAEPSWVVRSPARTSSPLWFLKRRFLLMKV